MSSSQPSPPSSSDSNSNVVAYSNKTLPASKTKLAPSTSEQASGEAAQLSVTQPRVAPTGFSSWWTIKNKATLVAVALGTLPVLIVGGIATAIAGKQLSTDAIDAQRQFANAISLQMEDFGTRRRQDAETPSDTETFTEEAFTEEAFTEEAFTEETSTEPLSEDILNLTEAQDLSELINQRVAKLRAGMDTEGQGLQFSVIDEGQNQVIISNSQTDIGNPIQSRFPAYTEPPANGQAFKSVSSQDNQPYLLTYAPVDPVEGFNNNLSVLVYQPISEVFAAQQSLVLTLLCGTVLTALVVSTLAAYLANRATQPIIAASKAVARLGRGKFETRLQVDGTDELAVLNSNINVMAEQLEYQLEFIQDSAQRQSLFQAQALVAQQHQRQKEALQRDLAHLVQSVEGVSEGNLTGQADPSTGEVSPVAEVLNSTTESLRKLVRQVRQAADQVDISVGANRHSIQQLSADAHSQAEEISQALTGVEQLLSSIQSMAMNAQQARAIARQAANTAQKGTQSMDQTVGSILGLRKAVATTTRKVKQLGEASGQISQVVARIDEIALKTNLLAINASIEASHAGEEGQGFAVVTGEIGQLAEQSARATKDIERIVKDIREGTQEVVKSMEASTAQVVEGSANLHETKESLVQLLSVSDQIDGLSQSISAATVSQTQTAQTVTNLMQQIEATSQRAPEFSRKADETLRDIVAVTQALEKAVGRFKVDQLAVDIESI